MEQNTMTQGTPAPIPSVEQQLLNITPNPRFQFETHLVEHCNLNCQMCTHFSPLARPSFTKHETFAADMQQMSKLFHDNEILRILLLGGEPLLHPDVSYFLETTRKNFPKAEIILYTNGLKLPQMGLSFWEICLKNRISITLTRYPISVDYDLIEHLLMEHNVNYQYCNTPNRSKKSSHYPLDLSGEQDPRHSFLHCDLANRCIFLRAGRLYTCTVIPNISHFNEFFKQHIEVSPLDSIDIYQAASGSEILRFLASPPPFCRYCDVSHRTILHEWAYSDSQIEEWT